MTRQAESATLTHHGEASKGKPIHVDVHALQDEQGRAYFWHEWRFENGPSQGKGKIDVPHKAPETPINFHLHDHTTLELKFLDESADCMWVSTGNCPTRKMNQGSQIIFPDKKAGQNLLKVRDRNEGDACTLKFALCFDGLAGRQTEDPSRPCPPYRYDPEIKNGGST
jgi:hypothetical protein